MSAEEATINPDGTQTMGEDAGAAADDAGADADAGAGGDAGEDAGGAGEEDFAEGMGGEGAAEDVVKGTDPAIFLFLGFVAIAALWFFFWYKKKKEEEDSDSFFSQMDGEKVSLLLILRGLLVHLL